MTVSLNDRWSSYFDIFLDICDSPDDIVGVYTFQVANEFGMSSAGIVIEGETEVLIEWIVSLSLRMKL